MSLCSQNVALPVRAGAGVESVRSRSDIQYIKVLVVALMCWLAFLHVRRRPAQIVCRGHRACQGHLSHEAWQVKPLPGVTTGAQLSSDMSEVLSEARSAFRRSLNWSAPHAMITVASSASMASSSAPAPAALLPPLRPVHVLTFADRPTIYLDALAASVMHFNEGAPLHVLGLSNRRTPAHPGPRWNIPRRAILGADPGKLKKLWFVGSLLDARAQLERLGFGETDLLLVVDAFDVFIQRPLRDFGDTFDALVASQLGGDERRRRSTEEAVVLLAEHSCWPWPLPGMARVGRPRGVSMAYMENRTFGVSPWPVLTNRTFGVSPSPVLTASTVAAEPSATAAREPAIDPAATEPSEDAADVADVSEEAPISSDQMCQEVSRRCLGGLHASAHHGTPFPQVRRRSLGGLWNYPNSGVFAGSVRAVRLALARMRRLVLRGHFEDQAIFHLAMLQHPRAALLVDANASLFASQFAYDASWWERPACFDDYWDAHGRAPRLLKAGNAPPPFALHFNGPAGRHRLGWCIAAVLAHTATAAAAAAAAAAITSDSPAHPPLVPFYYVDVDNGGRRHPLPAYCGQSADAGAASLLRVATPPPGRRAARLVSCEGEHIGQLTPIECTNDRCVHLHAT